jgi:hypothetical protein
MLFASRAPNNPNPSSKIAFVKPIVAAMPTTAGAPPSSSSSLTSSIALYLRRERWLPGAACRVLRLAPSVEADRG